MPTEEIQGELFPDTPLSPSGENGSGTKDENTQPAQPADPQPSSGQADTTAEDTGPKSMAEAIEAAFKAGEEKSLDNEDKTDPAEKKPAKGDKAKADADKSDGTVEGDGTEGEDDDPSDEEIAAMRPPVQKRIKTLLSQRNAARREAEEFRSDAGHYRNIRQFMAENSLEDREVAELFELGAHLKSGDPERLAKFLDRVMPRVQAVMEATGRLVPQDLRSKVEAGEMTEDAAKQFARERYARTAAEQKAQRVATWVQSQQDLDRVRAVQSAVASWEQTVRASDPDFDLKAGAMKRAAQALVAEKGLPKTADEAIERAKAVYEEVNQWFAASRPAPKPTRPVPASGPSASRTGLSPAPTSLADAIKFGLEAATRR